MARPDPTAAPSGYTSRKIRDDTVGRSAAGLEVPVEILSDVGDVNPWEQWALTSGAIRLGIGPKLATVSYALTQQWLRPALEAEKAKDWHRWLARFYTASLRVRTTRSETAVRAYDRGVISAEAFCRETGFDDADKPTEEEVAARQRQQSTGVQHDTLPTTPALPVDETEAESVPGAGPGDGLVAAADGLIWGR
ncbi:hypothetical protein Srufu_004130 [Streptomyces libani subsp. rufus]|nr:hypothetical protein Srufu_004130 [Streptomyces libani subsp. rufus]